MFECVGKERREGGREGGKKREKGGRKEGGGRRREDTLTCTSRMFGCPPMYSGPSNSSKSRDG